MADDSAHFFEPASGHGLAHDPFNAIVGPRPIGWIGSLNSAGGRNLAPYSFFNAFNYRPPIIGFSSIGWKDTVANIAATREFSWNLATWPLAQAMNASSSRLIAAPRVKESPVNFECRLSQLIQLESSAGKAVRTWLVLGEVVAVHIDRELIKDGVYDTAAGQPILRAGKMGDYAAIRPDAMFEMPRPA
jgi:flavin reductase (DIM6/NTAB) family NADH-FMN oxidoreductase RutF